MRYTHLIERTVENMQVLTDCTDAITGSLPPKFDKDERWMSYGEQLRGYQKLLSKYKGTSYEEVIRYFGKVLIIFDNREGLVGSSTMGAFVARPHNQLTIAASAFMQSGDQLKVSDLFAKRHSELPIKSIRALILHEIRHLAQSVLYQKYFYSDRSDVPYKTSPVEIDAAWTHHLEDYDPSKFPSVSAYAEAVMTSFAGYKSLTPAQKMHFRRKTARYYYDRTSPEVEAPGADPRARLTARRAAFGKMLMGKLGALAEQSNIDLRNLPGYNPQAERFLVPGQAFRGISAAVGRGERVKPDAAGMVYFGLSMVAGPGDARNVRRYAESVLGVTLDQAMAQADATFKGGFDADALKRHMQAVFG